MAPTKDKWTRRFIITETKRHKKGFTIYKVTSMIFLKSFHEEVSKVSVWKRYNDFKKLHSELGNLYKRLGIKEAFPTFPKSKYFGRFEAEVVEERKKYALKFLEFVGRHSYLYSSDIFITFFETSHQDNYTNDCAHSLSSDTSEDDRIVASNDSVFANDNIVQDTFQVPYLSKPSNILTSSCSTLSNVICTNNNEFTVHQKNNESQGSINLQNANINKEEQNCKITKLHVQGTKNYEPHIGNKDCDKNNITTFSNVSEFDNLNNVISKNLSNYDTHSTYPTILYEEVSLSQRQSESTQYLLIAAAHISAAFKHESIGEYEEAFTQYKLGISCLINGVKSDTDKTRILSIKDKVSKYLTRAEQLYNRHLNCNISIVKKPISELQYYKVLKIMKSVMLVMDIRANCNKIIKTAEKSCIQENNISNYVLCKQVPYMVHLYACIETETAIFLILQYASCGKLWDFVRLHYNLYDNSYITSNQICANRDINDETNNSENNCGPNKTENIMENNQVQNHRYMTGVQSEIYMEMPTIQLLEKSQELLQSVNATLEKSNSIANRLNKRKELKYSESTLSSDTETITQISQKSDLMLSNAHRDKSNPDMKMKDIIAENSLINNFVENRDLKGNNSLKNSKNLNISRNTYASILKESCTARNSLENKKIGNLYNNSISKTISIQNVSTDGLVHIRKTNNIENVSSQINLSSSDCSIDETQYQYTCKENNIDNNIEEQKLWQVPESVIRSWAAEILLALEALHQQNIFIFDFKPDNILLDDTGHIRLTYITPQHNIELSKLTYPYSSPELVMFSPTILITSATDIWSFGVILYELLTGITFIKKHPGLFHSHSTINIPSRLSESARSLLCGMLKYHPEERLTIDEIKNHQFFAKIDWLNMTNSPI
ncbi:hypothetical protein P5V15_000144 [Pogonomyrmex californicus]